MTENSTPENENENLPESEDIEVVAHTAEEDEELNAGCFFNGKSALA